jgi:hypothetical protein
LYASPNIIRVVTSSRTRWAGHVARMGEMRNAYNNLVWRSENVRQLGRPKRRWEGTIRPDLREIVWEGVHWISLTENREQWRHLVNTVMKLWVHKRWGISWLGEWLLASPWISAGWLVSQSVSHCVKWASQNDRNELGRMWYDKIAHF